MFRRTRFYNEVTVNGVKELDWLDNALGSFKLMHDYNYYLVSATDIARPDMISWWNYDTVAYWWVICLVNQIHNPFTDITVGMKLIIPSRLDINALQRKYKKR